MARGNAGYRARGPICVQRSVTVREQRGYGPVAARGCIIADMFDIVPGAACVAMLPSFVIGCAMAGGAAGWPGSTCVG